jgi:hypothetical protein
MSITPYVLVFILKASYGISIPYSLEFDDAQACQTEKARLMNAVGDKLLYINCAPKSSNSK